MSMAITTTLATAPGVFGAQWSLVRRTAGQAIAGAGLTEVGEAFGAISRHKDGTTSGQWYKTEAEARGHFERVTTPVVGQQ